MLKIYHKNTGQIVKVYKNRKCRNLLAILQMVCYDKDVQKRWTFAEEIREIYDGVYASFGARVCSFLFCLAKGSRKNVGTIGGEGLPDDL